MKTRIEPTGDRLLIKRLDTKDETDGGIILPDTAQTPRREGIVKAVGPGRVLDSGEVKPIDVIVGDRVIIPVHHVFEITHEGEDLVIMPESQIVGTYREVPAE